MNIPPPMTFDPIQPVARPQASQQSQFAQMLGGAGAQLINKRMAQRNTARPHRQFPNAQQAHQLDTMLQPEGHGG